MYWVILGIWLSDFPYSANAILQLVIHVKSVVILSSMKGEEMSQEKNRIRGRRTTTKKYLVGFLNYSYYHLAFVFKD